MPNGDCIVVCGGPSVGKTTTIKALKRKDRPVLREVGSVVIRQGLYHPAKDRHCFQEMVLNRQLRVEARRKRGGLWFLDRGLLDGAAYYLMDGLSVPDRFESVDVSHYLVCFLLERLGKFVHDGVRPQFESLQFTQQITPLLESWYAKKGVRVIRVPAMSADDRVSFIEAECEKILRLKANG